MKDIFWVILYSRLLGCARARSRMRTKVLTAYGCPVLGWHSGVRCVVSLYLAAISASKVW
jgi:hypothetical protein